MFGYLPDEFKRLGPFVFVHNAVEDPCWSQIVVVLSFWSPHIQCAVAVVKIAELYRVAVVHLILVY